MVKKSCPCCAKPMASGYLFCSGIYVDRSITSDEEYERMKAAKVWHCWFCHIMVVRNEGDGDAPLEELYGS